MQRKVKSCSFQIRGMTCVNCQNRIERELQRTLGVEDATVHFNTGTASVTYNEAVITVQELAAVIENLDYQVLDQGAPGTSGFPVLQLIGTLVIILSLYVLLRGFGMGTLASQFPLAEAGMGYGMLFIIGLLTSVHCMAMCGGINLSQCIPSAGVTPESGRRWKVLCPAMLYNTGRVISYTIMGTLVGALGSVVTVSGRFQGIVQILAGVFMVIMGITMLGFFPGLRRFTPRLPFVFARKIHDQKARNRHPLGVGLLNGLMPCGPLQAMQLYALSTGSPIAGGISLFLFSMGTVPLMFGIGVLSSALSRKCTRRVMQVGAILITVMGMTMVTYGFGLSGFNGTVVDRAIAASNPFSSKIGETGDGSLMPVIENGVQMVNSTLSGGRYPAITVQQGIPVQWTINAPAGSINGCNNRMIIREYGIEYQFTPGENLIEFTPDKTGRFPYSCWMGMIRSSITVVGEGPRVADEPDMNPSPAGVTIPADTVALAEMQENGYQLVKTNLRDDGVDPAIVVVQRHIPAVWIINNDSLDPGNSLLLFPAYYMRLDMEQGDNVVQFMPDADFDFSTGDRVFYGYVKVVDDLEHIDVEAIKAEAAAFETLLYPDAYFEPAAQAGGCCGGDASMMLAALPEGIFITRENRRKAMAFLLSHWHCIVPVIAIAVVMLLRSRGKKKQAD